MSNYSIVQINYASSQVTRYLSVILLLFGTVGNLLCCLVFIQRTLRSNPCVMYFLIATISNIIALTSGITPRMLSNWNIIHDRTETVSIFCKSRLFAILITRHIASWLLVCATIDRYLVSSPNVNVRRMSNLNQAFRWIGIVCIASLCFWAESLYCFDANLIGTPVKCYAKSDECRIYNDLVQTLVTSIIPSSLMAIFGLCTITNIRQYLRIQPSSVSNIPMQRQQRRRRKTDRSLLKMLFLQVILLTVFNLPQAIQKLYLTHTFYQSKSPIQIATENFLFNITVLLSYMPNCMPFYLYILTGELFRTTLFQLIRTIIRCLKCQLN